EPVRDLGQKEAAQRHADRPPLPAGGDRRLAQVHPLDELHRQEQLRAHAAEDEHLDDVAVVQRHGDARLVDERTDEGGMLGGGGVLWRRGIFSTPASPTVLTLKISAMPPWARRPSTWYLPKRAGVTLLRRWGSRTRRPR